MGCDSAVVITASMGASAVLLFAVPHGILSQPWSVIGGHIISAFVGVSIFNLVSNTYLSAPLAVGLAVLAMHYFKCIHPPGGATAIIPIIGGAEVHALGYHFVLFPIAINVFVIVLSAILFNSFFSWRRYPSSCIRENTRHKPDEPTSVESISHDDISFALNEMDLMIDVSEEDLLSIYNLAIKNKRAKASG